MKSKIIAASLLLTVQLFAENIKTIDWKDSYILIPKAMPDDGGFGNLYQIKYTNLGLKKFSQGTEVDPEEQKNAAPPQVKQ